MPSRFTIHHSRFTRLVRRALPALLTVPLFAEGQGRAWNSLAQVPYNGAFTFTRIRYGSDGFRRGGGAWAHDYPNADIHLPRILQYLSTIPVNIDASNVYDLDDPEVFRHPIIYLSEPGFWRITDREALALRKYLLKGGFLILDDFEHDHWYNMEAQLLRALPDHRLIQIGPDHPVFSSFFQVENIYVPHPQQITPSYFALFADNDPSGRMMVLVNFNADLAEYWEWSNTSFFSVDLSNEAYKLGVNYMFYGLTH